LFFPAQDPQKGQQLWKFDISNLKNNAPQLSGSLKDTTMFAGDQLKYNVPVFSFDDPNDYLSYVACLEDGSPLPEWLKFNSDTRTFSGIPPIAQSIQVKVTAFDRGNLSVSDHFTILVGEKSTGIKQKETNELRLFPNPAKDILTIEVDNELFAGKPIKITISDLQGRALLVTETSENVKMLNVTFIKSGIYSLKIEGGQTISRLFSVQK
jgi:hypothetical protein